MKSRKLATIVIAIVALLAGGYYLFSAMYDKDEAAEGAVTIPVMPPVNELPDLVVQMGE